MGEYDRDIQALSHYLIDEIVMAAGLKKSPAAQRLFHFFLHKLTERISSICVTTDRLTVTQGFPAAAGWMAGHWVRQVTKRGGEKIPEAGPLLVVSNHVGAYDIVVAPWQIGRRDVKIIASDTPFFRSLPAVSQHLIFASGEPRERMAAARQGIRHLQEGGCLLLFATGLVDPDPAVYPQPEKAIEAWSPSIDLFLHQAPQTQVMISILSGLVLPRWAHSPLTWLRKIDWQKRRIAEYGQVISQLLFPGEPEIMPYMSIAAPVDFERLCRESGSERVRPAVIERGKALMADHLEWIRTAAG